MTVESLVALAEEYLESGPFTHAEVVGMADGLARGIIALLGKSDGRVSILAERVDGGAARHDHES